MSPATRERPGLGTKGIAPQRPRPPYHGPSDAAQIGTLLDSPEITALVSELEATRWTGRPGYPLRSMIGMALAKSVYAVPTWTRTVALVREHAALRAAIAGSGDMPSVHACYRFTAKLRATATYSRAASTV